MDYCEKWNAERERKAFLALADGTVWHGVAFGAKRDALGEVVFNTGMCGYQEIVTDPSYAGQFVALTAAEVGNYGVNCEDVESRGLFLSGLVLNDLTPFIFTPEHVARLEKAALRTGKTAKAHLKLDTGMSRVGVITDSELDAFIEALKSAPHVVIDGLASHLANSEILTHPENAAQIQRFRQAHAHLEAAGIHPKWRHIANSGALLQIDAAHDGQRC